jgi:hypothetical protein
MKTGEVYMKYNILNSWTIGSISNYLFQDVMNRKDVSMRYIYDLSAIQDIQLLKRIYFFVNNRRPKNREKRIGKMIDRIIADRSGDTVVIMTNEMLCYLREEHLRKLQDNGIKLVLVLIDPIAAEYNTASAAREMMKKVSFDLVMSFDPADCAEYGFEYCNSIYSVIAEKKDCVIKHDICYMGNIKDRFHFIRKLLKAAKANNAELLLRLAGCSPEEMAELPEEVPLKHVLRYDQIIDLTQESNCIFDMTQSGQTGVTYRYYEAVVYNRKLLTNNRAIAELPYYDSRYIRFYDSVEDIDWEWVKCREPVDFGYKGDFSPEKLLEMVERKLNNKS